MKRKTTETRASRRAPKEHWEALRLKDRISPGVRVLFVGINPGVRSAMTGHHFAGFSNRFWKLLYESGLVPQPIACEDDVRLPEWGYGITNLIARPSPGIDDLKPAEYAEARAALTRKVRRYKPEIVALVGVTLFRALFPEFKSAARKGPPYTDDGLASRKGPPHTQKRRAGLYGPPTVVGEPQTQKRRAGLSGPPTVVGEQAVTFEGARVFVLPNPSGRNANFSYGEMLDAFRKLRERK